MVKLEDLKENDHVWLIEPVRGRSKLLFNLRGKVVRSVNVEGGSLRVLDARGGKKERLKRKHLRHLFTDQAAGLTELRLRLRLAVKNHTELLKREVGAAAEFDKKIEAQLDELRAAA